MENNTPSKRAQFIHRVPLRNTIVAFPNKISVYCVRVDGGKIYAAGEAKWIGVWDLKSISKIRELHGHLNKVYCIGVENDTVVSGSEDMTVKVWDGETGECKRTCTGHTGAVLCVLYTGDKCFSGSLDKSVIEWDLDIGVARRSFSEHSGPIFALQFLAPSTLITGSIDTTVKWWDLDAAGGGKCKLTKMSHKDAVLCIEVGLGGPAGGGHLATGGGKMDKSLRVWDLDTKSEKATMQGHEGSIRSLVHITSSKVVTGSTDGTVREWDLNTWSQTRVLVENDAGIFSIQYEDGVLVTGSYDGTIKVYDMVSDLHST